MLKKYVTNFLETNLGSDVFYKIGNALFSIPQMHKNGKYTKIYQKELYKGYANKNYIPYYPHRIWPYWVYKQIGINSKSYNTQGINPILTNTTCRNWTPLSFPGCNEMPIIDPKGLITPFQDSWSLDFWVANSEKVLSPSQINKIDQSFDPKTNTIVTKYETEHLRVSSESYFKELLPKNLLFNQITLQNKSQKTISFSFFFAIRPYNPEGLSPINEIIYHSDNSFLINNQLGVILDQKPDNIVCLSLEDGDISEKFNKWEMILDANCSHQLASGFAEYRASLQPNETIIYSCKLNTEETSRIKKVFQTILPKKDKKNLKEEIKDSQELEFQKEQQGLISEWESQSTSLCKIILPNKKYETAFNKNIAHIQSLIGKERIYAGPFTYKKSWIKEACIICNTLNKIGLSEKTESFLNTAIFNKQKIDSNINLNDIETISSLMVAIMDYYNFSKDIGFLENKLSFVNKSVKTILKQINTNRNNSPHLNLLVNKSYSCDPLSQSDFYFSDNFWATKSLLLSNDYYKILNKQPSHPLLYDTTINHLKRLESIILKVTEAIEPPYIPVSPHKLYDSRLIYSLSALYPLQLLSETHPLVKETLNQIEKNYTLNSIYFNQSTPSGFNSYHNALLSHIYALFKNETSFKILDWLIENNNKTGGWAETIHPISKGGCYGEGFYGITSAEYINTIRSFLVQEDKNTLHLTPFFPKEWLDDPNMVIAATNLPTHFGNTTFKLTKKKNRLELTLENEFHTPPKEIHISFPIPIQILIINNKEHYINNTTTKLPNTVTKCEFELKTDSKK